MLHQWPYVPSCNGVSVGVISVISESALGTTTCSTWEITGTAWVIGDISNAFEDPIPYGLCFSAYFYFVFQHISE